jgi:hypothetical protein
VELYISNIEKGKNNSPSNITDLEVLAAELTFHSKDRFEFYEKAVVDRFTLPKEMIEYIYQCSALKDLIRYGIENNMKDDCWKIL